MSLVCDDFDDFVCGARRRVTGSSSDQEAADICTTFYRNPSDICWNIWWWVSPLQARLQICCLIIQNCCIGAFAAVCTNNTETFQQTQKMTASVMLPVWNSSDGLTVHWVSDSRPYSKSPVREKQEKAAEFSSLSLDLSFQVTSLIYFKVKDIKPSLLWWSQWLSFTL